MSAIQDELPLPEPELPPSLVKLREADVLEVLHKHYGFRYGNGPRYVGAEHVRSHAGFDCRRTADFVAMDLWPSKGLALHGHEVKVSRAGWLTELGKPEKAAEFIPYVNYWWLVAGDERIVRNGELPYGWGMMAVRGSRLVTVKPAPKRDAQPMEPSRLAALLRAVAKTSAKRAATGVRR